MLLKPRASFSPNQCPSSQFHNLITSETKSYQIDDFTVQTKDGYILQIFRVRLSQKSQQDLPVKFQQNLHRPILLQHGLIGSSDDWFINSLSGSLGYHLVGQGYDVWVGNNRGNKYAQGHTNSKISDYDFYNFSFEQMGLFDMPAIYSKILRFYAEGQKIVYMGTSQGSSQMYVGLTDDSTKDFLRKHIKRFIAVAPIAYMTEVTSSGLQ